MFLRKTLIVSNQVVEPPKPDNLQVEDVDQFDDLTRTLPEVNLIYYKCVFVSYTGLVISNLFISKLSAIDQLLYKYNRYSGLRLIKNNSIKLIKNLSSYVLVTDEWSTNYFHFLCDVLPRLLIAKANLGREFRLILPENIAEKYKEAFELFGFNQYTIIKSSELVFVPNLIMPTHVFRPSGVFSPNMLSFLVDNINHVVANCNSNLGSDFSRIYISRSKASSRKVLNEDEVLPILLENDFKIVYAEDLSFIEQVQMFSSCNILVSPHGAGLTNMLFMPTGSVILELRNNTEAPNNTFLRLAKGIGHKYYYLLSHENNGCFQSDDLQVDASKLNDLLLNIVTT